LLQNEDTDMNIEAILVGDNDKECWLAV